MVEDERYTKYGLHKGDRGFIANPVAVSNSILVNFSSVNEDCDCCSIALNDLKKIDNKSRKKV